MLKVLSIIALASLIDNPSPQAKKKTEAPDVSLVIPAETRPEIKAILNRAASDMRSADAKTRIRGAQMVGELKEEGKPIRQILCRRMLDPVPSVRVAAADALREIDPEIQRMAVDLTAARPETVTSRMLREVAKNGDAAEPLMPIIRNLADLWAASNARPSTREEMLNECITTLAAISPNDITVYRYLATALDNPDVDIRANAIQALMRMKHRVNAVPRLLGLLKADPPTRILVVQALAILADSSNEEVIEAGISKYRYDEKPEVRQAVEKAMNDLKQKKTGGGNAP